MYGVLQVSTAGHLSDDVTPAQQLPIHIELRKRRPVKHLLQPLPNVFISQYIKGLEWLFSAL